MKERLKKDEAWIRARLPAELAGEDIFFFQGERLDGLAVLREGERGGPETVVFRAESEEELRWWELEIVCRFIKRKHLPARKVWRWYRDHAEQGHWRYVEHRRYDYNAIDDARLYGFECTLSVMKHAFPPERFEAQVHKRVGLMNRWFRTPHWDYDREKLCFIEISDSREYASDTDMTEEPRPGSVIAVVD